MAIFSILLSAAFITSILLYLQFRWHYRKILSTASKLPCPPSLPIIGNAHYFIGSVSCISKNITRITTRIKGTFCIWIGPVPLFVVSDPSDLQTVFNSSNTLEKDGVYKFFKPFIGNGLITAPVPMWKKYRRLINPVLHPSNIERFMPVFNDVSRQLAQGLIESVPTDPRNNISRTSLDAIMRTVISRSDTADTAVLMDTMLIFDLVGRMFVKRLFKVWLHFDWIFNILYKKEVCLALKKMTDCLDLIDQGWRDEKRLRNETPVENQEYEPNRLKSNNLVDVVFANPQSENEDHDWRHEVTTMIVASMDTVGATLSFLIITLANHPETQEKIYAEILSVVGNSDRDVTVSELNSMTYLNQAILETMRLHGIIPFVLRRVTKDTQLSKCTLPAGSRLLIPLHAMGYNTDHFPEPDKFLPDRFSQENVEASKRDRYAFLPFSAGPRNCIGKTYAMLYVKTVMVHILRRYHVTSHLRLEDIEYEMKIVMYSKTPVDVQFHRR